MNEQEMKKTEALVPALGNPGKIKKRKRKKKLKQKNKHKPQTKNTNIEEELKIHRDIVYHQAQYHKLSPSVHEKHKLNIYVPKQQNDNSIKLEERKLPVVIHSKKKKRNE